MDFPLSQATSLDMKDGRFTDGIPGLYPSSIIPSGTTNDIIDEILAVQAAGGVAKNEFNKTQLKTAIQNMIEARVGDYALDTGIANAYVVAMNPPVSAWINGMEGAFRVAHSNTGASTLDAGPGPKSLVNDVGGALLPGDLPAAAFVGWIYDAPSDKCLMKSMVTSQTLSKAAADLLYAPLVDASTTVKGTVQLATATEAQALSNALKAMTPATLASALQGGNQSLATSGYQKFPGGLIVLWGSIAASFDSTAISVTFPISFPNNCFIAAPIMSIAAAVNGAIGLFMASKSKTGAVFVGDNSDSTSSGTLYYFAVGN